MTQNKKRTKRTPHKSVKQVSELVNRDAMRKNPVHRRYSENAARASQSSSYSKEPSIQQLPSQDSDHPKQAVLVRISGPVVIAQDLQASMFDVALVGNERLLAEVIQIHGSQTTLQVYEDTVGLQPGEPVVSTGKPLCAELGPGLLSSIFDGIQRPLDKLAVDGAFIKRGAQIPSLDRQKKWRFSASAQLGTKMSGGQILGSVEELPGIMHHILIPPLWSGLLTKIASGTYTVEEQIGELEADDGTVLPLRLMHNWPVRVPRPVERKFAPETPLITGQRVIDVLFPIAKGGTAIISGPFGAGKTVAQHQLAKWSDADIILYVGCGERGNEMTEVLTQFPLITDPRSGAPLMHRTVLIANTSNMPVAAREASIYTGATIAEYFRDQGLHVALMADSTSRWAESLREISSRLEEMPGEEGYPAYLVSRVAAFYERAALVQPLGSTARTRASVTIIGAVSPPGGDFSEPVTQASLRVAKVFWALDAKIAQKRHFPSINWLEAYSLYTQSLLPWFMTHIAHDWQPTIEKLNRILQEEARLLEIVQIVGSDALAQTDQFTLHIAKLIRETLLQQQASDALETFCEIGKSYQISRIISLYHTQGFNTIIKGGSLKGILDTGISKQVFSLKFEKDYEHKANMIANSIARDMQHSLESDGNKGNLEMPMSK